MEYEEWQRNTLPLGPPCFVAFLCFLWNKGIHFSSFPKYQWNMPANSHDNRASSWMNVCNLEKKIAWLYLVIASVKFPIANSVQPSSMSYYSWSSIHNMQPSANRILILIFLPTSSQFFYYDYSSAESKIEKAINPPPWKWRWVFGKD